ncbi:type II toxin-antitoxin system PemK/MazF family toxin [Cytobacillus oceanisediminis]|uniref:type II toxin-antitoxin system PemK/MazF family toxin n=1 Tax=Cytobacillus oceanisediminis TaxID=665099 RepID=UPI001CCDCEED|nr:type II toxin-antitoxin system PemK/MazF family toxin [Cytobacillus oceanisediminis]MBZ9537031.1 type II toxin-antitoxin system PemK/MazF family toxin [Cytobacillus oceanisediminis]
MCKIKRGDIYWTDLSPTRGSEQSGNRPALVIQNDIGNRFSPTVIIAILTKVHKKELPTHVYLDKDKYRLEYNSVVMLEQIRTIDKWRIGDKISSLDEEKMEEVKDKLIVSLGFDESKLALV